MHHAAGGRASSMRPSVPLHRPARTWCRDSDGVATNQIRWLRGMAVATSTRDTLFRCQLHLMAIDSSTVAYVTGPFLTLALCPSSRSPAEDEPLLWPTLIVCGTRSVIHLDATAGQQQQRPNRGLSRKGRRYDNCKYLGELHRRASEVAVPPNLLS